MIETQVKALIERAAKDRLRITGIILRPVDFARLVREMGDRALIDHTLCVIKYPAKKFGKTIDIVQDVYD